MSATAICEEPVQVRRERRPCTLHRGVNLAQLLTRAYEDALAGDTAECAVCGGVMERSGLQAVCGGCGSRLT